MKLRKGALEQNMDGFRFENLKYKIKNLEKGITKIKNEIVEVESAIGINNDFNEMDRLLVRMSGLYASLNNKKAILIDYKSSLMTEREKS